MSQPAGLPRLEGMMKWLLKNRLAAFEREFGYDASYMRDLLDADFGAFLKFAKVQGLARYRKDIPVDVYCAAGLTGSLIADCGPCTQLGVTLALREGVSGQTIAAILEGRVTGDVALGAKFARAVLARDPIADDLREEILTRWGRRALISLGFAITSSQMWPALKYALGHGKACQRVIVEGQTIVPKKAA